MNSVNKKKPNCNISTIGHVDHGKTTLTASITKVLSEENKTGSFMKYEDIDNAPEEKARGITINASHVSYETKKRHYAHVDSPGHNDYIKNMITGTHQIDGAILVVSVTDGVMPQTVQHVLLCSRTGVKRMVVFLNKIDMIPEEDMVIVDLVKEEILSLLVKYGFDADSPIVVGSALLALESADEEESKYAKMKEDEERRCQKTGTKFNLESFNSKVEYMRAFKKEYGKASVLNLMNIVDEYIELGPRDYNKPFLMAIEGTVSISGRGTVVTGKVECGVLKPNDEVEIVGLSSKPFKTTVVQIEAFRKVLPEATPSDDVGILLRGIEKGTVFRGQVLAKPGNIKPYTVFEADFRVQTPEEGGRHTGFSAKYSPQLYIRTADVTAVVESMCSTETSGPVDDQIPVKVALPGESVRIKFRLLKPIALSTEVRFTAREARKTVGSGVVTRLVEAC